MDRSLGLDESSVGVHHLLSLSVNVEEELDLPDHGAEEGGGSTNSVEAAVVGNDLGEGVGGGAVSGVVDVDGAAAHGGSKDPVAAVVDVQDDDLVGVEGALDAAVGNLADVGEAQRVDGSPDEQVSADISSVPLEPGVERSGVIVLADATEGHGDRAHEAPGLADSVGGGSQLLAAPFAVALLVEGVGSAGREDEEHCQKQQFGAHSVERQIIYQIRESEVKNPTQYHQLNVKINQFICFSYAFRMYNQPYRVLGLKI